MVKIMAIGIDAIMTSQAVLAISLEVRLHEISVDLLVAGEADGLVKHHIAINMACSTCERRTILLALVGS